MLLEHLEFKNFSCQPTMVSNNNFQCPMAPPILKMIWLALQDAFHRVTFW